ncbi:MAG: hypothetical protein KatS3mg111_0919 [Pirellulaceae bacterium]|nr:MAG: hypothetical protein KatS3mg111_0919 [Pirellulaceae bacterium]
MRPLTPDDLLIRNRPVEDQEWMDEAPPHSSPTAEVQLERFQVLERVIRDQPLTEAPYLELARIYLTQRRWQDAKRVLDQAVKRFPDQEDVLLLHEAAQLNRSLQLLEQAEHDYQRMPTEGTRKQLARCQLELNVLREQICRARLQRHPESFELYLPLADALAHLGKRDEAIACLGRAAQVPTLRCRANLRLGQFWEQAGQPPQALAAYRRAALTREPPPEAAVRREALTAAANLAEKHGMIDSARRYLRELANLNPDDAVYRLRLAALEDASL